MGIEDLFYVSHCRQFSVIEHQRHVLSLFDADTVFAAEASSLANGQFDHLTPGAVNALQQVPVLGVWNQDERMEIAITRVEHIAHAQPIPITNLVYFKQGLRQATARDGNIHGIIGWRQAGNCSSRALASKPDLVALFGAAGDAQVTRSVCLEELSHVIYLPIQAGRIAVHVDDQDGLGLGW